MDTSLTYGQLLELPEWQEKRNAILKRDKHICQNCNNTNYEKDNFYGPYLQISSDKKPPYSTFKSFSGKAEQVFVNDENGTRLIPPLGKVMLYFSRHKCSGIDLFPNEGYYVSAARYFTDDELLYYYPSENPNITDNEKVKLMSDTISQLLGKSNDLKSLPERKDLINVPLTELKWIFAKDLHVHHTYYQIDKLPWQYPDESLQTLCRSCHEKVHDEELIPVRDANGVKIGNYKPCTRCNGAGGFPEYKNVENGICFQCRGDKYLSDKFIVKD